VPRPGPHREARRSICARKVPVFAGTMMPVKRQRKSGASTNGVKIVSKLLSRPLTKDSFAKTVEIMPDGSRNVSLSPEAMELLEEQRNLFREKFGREPGPHDSVFFDPDADKPQPMPPLDPAVLEALAVEAGVRPEIAFAMAKTGVYLMKENEHLYRDTDKKDFWAAVAEYRKRASHQDA